MPGSKPSSASPIPEARPITREDIEAKIRSIGSEVEQVAESTKRTMVLVGTVVVVAAVLGAFVMGKRTGRKKTAFIEIRRV